MEKTLKINAELLIELNDLKKELSALKFSKEKTALEIINIQKDLNMQLSENVRSANEIDHVHTEIDFLNKEKSKLIEDLEISKNNFDKIVKERGMRADELIIANKELIFQNREKERRADDLNMAMKELAFQNEEKEKLNAELFSTKKELVTQLTIKNKQASELSNANKKLFYNNHLIEKKADELITINKELEYLISENNTLLTELKDSNKELINKNADLKLSKLNLSLINKQLKESVLLNDDKNLFISIISHDLRSPLNSILGLTKLLVLQVNNKKYERTEEFVSTINLSTNKALNLLSSLTIWAQSQSGSMKFNQVNINIIPLINQTKELLKENSEQKNIVVSSNLPHEIMVTFDKEMINTVLRNLLSNAIKFTDINGKITIETKISNNELIVSISDTGVGIPKARVAKLFKINEKYSSSGTQNEKGTGLGLILCKEFVEKNNGKIWVESSVGVGSTFFFSLPL